MALRKRWQGKWTKHVDMDPSLRDFLTSCGTQLDDLQAEHILRDNYEVGERAGRELHRRFSQQQWQAHTYIMDSCWALPSAPLDTTALVLDQPGGELAEPLDAPGTPSQAEDGARVKTCSSRKQQRRALRKKERPPPPPSEPRASAVLAEDNF